MKSGRWQWMTWAFLALVAVGAAACGDDPAPDFDHEIRVESMRFFPNVLSVKAGETVRWVNVLRKDAESLRTVTSGTGPGDPAAGAEFDVQLDGFNPGEPQGQSFTMKFDEAGTVEYFTRLPEGEEYFGTLIVE